jgi:excisionase family DNA binding protein
MESPSQDRARPLSGADFLTVTEVAALLRVPLSWIYARTFRGAASPLPCIRVGRLLRFRRADLEKWLDDQNRSDE